MSPMASLDSPSPVWWVCRCTLCEHPLPCAACLPGGKTSWFPWPPGQARDVEEPEGASTNVTLEVERAGGTFEAVRVLWTGTGSAVTVSGCEPWGPTLVSPVAPPSGIHGRQVPQGAGETVRPRPAWGSVGAGVFPVRGALTCLATLGGRPHAREWRAAFCPGTDTGSPGARGPSRRPR